MAIKNLIALCLVFASLTSAHPVPEAESESKSYYVKGYVGGYRNGYGHRFGYNPYAHVYHHQHRQPYLFKTRPGPNAAVTVPQIKNTPDTPTLEALSTLDTPALEVMTIPETPPPAPEPSFILQEVLLEVPEAKPKILKSSAVVSVNSVKLQNKNEKDAYAAFKPVPAVPEDHIYSAVDFMAAPTPAPPAVFSRAQEIVPIFDEDIDVIASVPEETIIAAPEIPTEPIFEVIDLNEIDLIKAAPEPVIAPEPAVAPEPVSAPKPAIAPEPVSAPEPVFAPEPVIAPEPVVELEQFSAPEPIIAPEVLPEFPFPPMPTEQPIFEVFENYIEAVIHAEKEKLILAPELEHIPAPISETYKNGGSGIESEIPSLKEHLSPIPTVTAPLQPPKPIQGVVASQYHAQDEFGNVVYGYSNANSAKNEQRDALGNVIGSYSYLDGTGYPKHVAYSADEFGFRITNANNFPLAVAPV